MNSISSSRQDVVIRMPQNVEDSSSSSDVSALKYIPPEPHGVSETRKKVNDFADIVGRPVETPQELIGRLAEAAPPENLDQLCQYLGLNDEQSKQQLKDGIRNGLARASTEPTTIEANAQTAAAAKVAGAQGASKDVTKMAQFKNNLAAGTVSWVTGFGAAVGLTKGVAAALGKSAIHFIDFGGPFMLLGSEVIAGKFRAHGPGYAAADLAAYTSHDVLVADQSRLGKKMAGVADSGRKDTAAYQKLNAQHDKMTVARQTTCVGLIRRELGRVLGLKTNPAETDAPGSKSCLLGCMHSQLAAADDGSVSLRDGTPLFTYDKTSPKGTFNVTWPDGKVTNLLAEKVPTKHAALFARAESDLVGAARVRSFVADEITVMTFAGVEALSALGPWVTGTFGASKGTVTADALIGVTVALFGTQAYLHTQNAARSVITGQAPGKGISRAEQTAKYEKAELSAHMHRARLKQIATMRAACKTELVALRRAEKELVQQIRRDASLLVDPENQPEDAAETNREKLDEVQKKIGAHKEAYAELKTLFRATAKEKAAAKASMKVANSKLEGTRVGAMESWMQLWKNKPLLACKLAAYTTAFVVYSAAYAHFTYSLLPGSGHDSPGNFGDPGNLTDPGNFSLIGNFSMPAPFSDPLNLTIPESYPAPMNLTMPQSYPAPMNLTMPESYPAPENSTVSGNVSLSGNLTESGVAASGDHSLANYLLANAFNATVIALPFVFKNNVIVPATYSAYSTVAGGIEYVVERARGAFGPAVAELDDGNADDVMENPIRDDDSAVAESDSEENDRDASNVDSSSQEMRTVRRTTIEPSLLDDSRSGLVKSDTSSSSSSVDV